MRVNSDQEGKQREQRRKNVTRAMRKQRD